MKKTVSVLLCIVCLLCLCGVADASTPLVTDEAGILTAAEEAALEASAQKLRDTYGIDAVIATVASIDTDPQAFARKFYQRKGYANDGIILLISMAERDYALYTFGECADIFTPYGLEVLEDSFLSDLRNDRYKAAFGAFLSAIPDYCEAYRSGDTIDIHFGLTHVLIALVIGIVVGAIAIAVMRGMMNTAKPKPSATEYVRQGSFRPYGNFDMYLYSRVMKIRKQQNSSGSRGGGGGGHGRSGKF